MDVACSTVRARALKYINASVRVNKTTGFILEKEAVSIERDINSGLKSTLLDPQPTNASATQVVVSRTQNILSTATMALSVRVTPLGYSSFIAIDIGFVNPALATNAA